VKPRYRALWSPVFSSSSPTGPRWRRPTGDIHWRLTSREREVLELLAQDQSTAHIAGQLLISASAVRVHVAAIARKLEVSGRPAAVDLLRQRPTA
jgi:LuxR family transcriptional regulator, transcriptional regulator of spore coat protein